MNDTVIGIDLGTTKSCASCYLHGRVRILENKEGTKLTPSYLFFKENCQVIVGENATYQSNQKPDCGIYGIKRLLGRKFNDVYVQNSMQYFPFKMGNDSNDPFIFIHPMSKITPQELCTMILRKIKEDAETELESVVNKAVITVPASFNVTQREVILEAANHAGFIVLKLLNEPTATALSYYFESKCRLEYFSLVYDLGGGTFDVAIIKKYKSQVKVACVDGDSHLGGNDFDNLIVDYVCEQLVKNYCCNPKSDKRVMRRLRNQCEEAKKRLSSMEETTITLNGLIKYRDVIEIPISREQFEIMAFKLFKTTIDIVDRCLKSCDLPSKAIKEIILSGGSTRIPKIRELLSSYFNGRKLKRLVDTDECVAEGAALQAAMLSTSPAQIINYMQISDVTPLSLGISDFVGLMNVLIKRNTPIPTSRSVTRYTVCDGQKSVRFEIYEGERLNAKKNRHVGTMMVLNLTPGPPGHCEIILTMSIDLNGILKVTAQEKCRDSVKDLEINYSRDFWSDTEVILRDSVNHTLEDKWFKNFAFSKQYCLKYCAHTMYNLKDKLVIGPCRELYDFCERSRVLAKNFDVEDEEKLQELIYQIKLRCAKIQF